MSDILLFTLTYTNTFYNLQVATAASLNLAQICVFQLLVTFVFKCVHLTLYFIF